MDETRIDKEYDVGDECDDNDDEDDSGDDNFVVLVPCCSLGCKEVEDSNNVLLKTQNRQSKRSRGNLIGVLQFQGGDGWGGVGVAEANLGIGEGDVVGALATMDDADKLIWHPQVPLKVSIFTWRLLRDRLPTKTNLVTRDILSPAAHFCVSSCGAADSAHHLFISCNTFGSLWTLVCSWIVITPVHSTSIHDHFVQFTCSAGGSRAWRSFLQLI
ncbi:hypothetical protein TSUD_284320 [Trifolium subterraneum]|uniref:Reverse transcriptase zinc-binding domain-containing protein n=1 Tax=Trifolium subterraneum TaxID=3900 RepID=A0A2Z6NXL6_TRISU|nr:hypothetical protein TSUD_284320 [Trifolium subterraneum]